MSINISSFSWERLLATLGRLGRGATGRIGVLALTQKNFKQRQLRLRPGRSATSCRKSCSQVYRQALFLFNLLGKELKDQVRPQIYCSICLNLQNSLKRRCRVRTLTTSREAPSSLTCRRKYLTSLSPSCWERVSSTETAREQLGLTVLAQALRSKVTPRKSWRGALMYLGWLSSSRRKVCSWNPLLWLKMREGRASTSCTPPWCSSLTSCRKSLNRFQMTHLSWGGQAQVMLNLKLVTWCSSVTLSRCCTQKKCCHSSSPSSLSSGLTTLPSSNQKLLEACLRPSLSLASGGNCMKSRKEEDTNRGQFPKESRKAWMCCTWLEKSVGESSGKNRTSSCRGSSSCLLSTDWKERKSSQSLDTLCFSPWSKTSTLKAKRPMWEVWTTLSLTRKRRGGVEGVLFQERLLRCT